MGTKEPHTVEHCQYIKMDDKDNIHLLEENFKFDIFDKTWKVGRVGSTNFQLIKENFPEVKIDLLTCQQQQILIATDASNNGIAAVLLQKDIDKIDIPVMHLSHTSKNAQKNYSKTEKEALSIIYAACKGLVKDYKWWPSIAIDIKRMVKSSQSCHENGIMIPERPTCPWSPSIEPWERIHIDFCFMIKQVWFVLIHAFTKWAEVYRVKQVDPFTPIQRLRDAFQ
ncbi:hypothetical protein RF11_12489 [Thelohanellus kitauei]|uniref:Reverse transcriptase/retrotransposon-derived protein RNase H-like domain-containing protein n=1 Tax=Thelohanellus kitauei TaxID=669202 RepID=A0A0C2MIE5_THEKT|nr:hypothetical protein RF11_12489 [Thelohanellus kitauei]